MVNKDHSNYWNPIRAVYDVIFTFSSCLIYLCSAPNEKHDSQLSL